MRSFYPLPWNIIMNVLHDLLKEEIRKQYRPHYNTILFAIGCLSKSYHSAHSLKAKKILILLFLSLPLLSYTTEISAQNTEDCGFVVYTDSVSNASYIQSINRPMISRTAKSEQGQIFSRQKKIIATYDDNYFMTEGVKHCLKIAMNTWEERLDIKVPIKFFVCISEDLDPEIEIATTVSYSRKNQRESLPDNLYYQTLSTENETHDTIKINAFVDWDSSWQYDSTYSGSVSLSRSFLRHIAHILGFGCSIVKRNGGLGTAVPRALSPFDRLITDGQRFLSSINYMNSSELEQFLSKPLRLKSSSFDYNIYKTEKYIPLRSGNYFSLGHDNIMEYPQTNVAQLLSINKDTLDVITAIGWNVKPYNVEISCVGTDVLGYGSIYNNLQFSAHKAITQETAGQAVWQYQAYNKTNGIYENIATHSGTTFTVVPKLSSSSLDEFSSLEARIVCRISETEYTLPLSLETRPLIENITISNVSYPDSQHYKFDLYIQQKGASKGTILVSDDTGAVLQYGFTGSTIHVGPLVKGFQAYIDISLSNAYGTTSKFITGNLYETSNFAKKSDESKKIEMKVNGATGISVLHDSDNVELSLSDTNINMPIDSLKWYACLVETSGDKLYKSISKEKECTFSVHPGIFGCYFEKQAVTGEMLPGGAYWYNLTGVIPDSCKFICTVYTHSNWGNFVHTLTSPNLSFDVLPKCPTINILSIYTAEDKTGLWPMAKINIDTENFDSGIIYVCQNNGFPTFIDTVFTKDDFDLSEYTLDAGDWNNDIYCIAINSYGQYKSAKTKIIPTGIENIPTKDEKILVRDKSIEIRSNHPIDALVYDISGKLKACAKSITNHTVKLQAGYYVIVLRDKIKNKTTTKKILLK